MATSLLVRNNWFGKAVLTTGAFAIAPLDITSTLIWSAVGFGLGYQIDQFAAHNNLTLKQSANAWRLLRQTKHHNPWMIFTFAALGEMARIAGSNNAACRAHSTRLMQDLRFDPEAKERAREWYKAGMQDGCPIPELAARCRRFGHYEFEPFALQSLEQAASLHDRASIRMASQLAFRGLSALLGKEAPGPSSQQQEATGEPNPQQQQHKQRRRAPKDRVSQAPKTSVEARRLLGVEASANQAQIKTAYRRLASKHHPDRLPEGSSNSDREQAQTRMANINSAKELLDAELA